MSRAVGGGSGDGRRRGVTGEVYVGGCGQHQVALGRAGPGRGQAEIREALGPEHLDAGERREALAQALPGGPGSAVQDVDMRRAAVPGRPGEAARHGPTRVHLDESFLAQDLVEVVDPVDIHEAVVAEDQERSGLGPAERLQGLEEPPDEPVHLGEGPAGFGARRPVIVLERVQREEVEQEEPRGSDAQDVARRFEREPVLHGAERVLGAPGTIAGDRQPAVGQLRPERSRRVALEQLLVVELRDARGVDPTECRQRSVPRCGHRSARRARRPFGRRPCSRGRRAGRAQRR